MTFIAEKIPSAEPTFSECVLEREVFVCLYKNYSFLIFTRFGLQASSKLMNPELGALQARI